MKFGFARQVKIELGTHALWAGIAGILTAGVNFLGLRLYPYPDDAFLPLHYNLYFGIDYIGKFSELYAFPLFGLTSLIINLAVSILLMKKIPILSYTLIYSALLIQALILVSLILILLKF